MMGLLRKKKKDCLVLKLLYERFGEKVRRLVPANGRPENKAGADEV